MADQGLPTAIDLVCQKDGRYAPAAYQFLREALDRTVAETGRDGNPLGERHVSGAELCHGLRQHALAEYGPLARTVLAHWGITNTNDFGNLVFNLIDAGLFGKSSEDSPEDFQTVFSFEEAFTEPFQARVPWTPKQNASA